MPPPTKRLSAQFRQSPTRYEPISRIATGGMAEVWKARAVFATGQAQEVAIKRVLPAKRDPLLLAMLEDEARLGMLLRHPNIVRVYDARSIGTTYIVVMELVEGDTLKGLLDPPQMRGAVMPLAPALVVARGLARALEYTHGATDPAGRRLGVVHRDVSPHNVLLGRDGSVKLTDFGLADAVVNEAARGRDIVGGKPGYLAPEVIQGAIVDHRVDLFAFGVVLWEMLAGRRLFQGDTDAETVRRVARCEVPSLASINGAVPRDLDALVRSLLAPDPSARPKSAGEASAALSALIERLDRPAGERDVALLVGLHLAKKALEAEPQVRVDAPFEPARLVAAEMDQFAMGAAGTGAPSDMGAARLDRGAIFAKP